MKLIILFSALFGFTYSEFADNIIRNSLQKVIPRNLIQIKGPIFVEPSSLQQVSPLFDASDEPFGPVGQSTRFNPFEAQLKIGNDEQQDEIIQSSKQQDQANQVWNVV